MRRQQEQDDVRESDGFDGQTAGCHPLKKLKRQSLDEFEDEFMSQSRPAAKVVNMRAKQQEAEQAQMTEKLPQQKQVEDPQGVFFGIREHDMAISQSNPRESREKKVEGKKKMSLFAQRRAQMKEKEQGNQQIGNAVQISQSSNPNGAQASFPESFKVYEPNQEEVKEIRQNRVIPKTSELGQIGVGDKAITEENMKQIDAMSPEEIKEAQRQILEMLGGSHEGALQKFKTNFGKAPEVKSLQKEEEKEEQEVFQSKKQAPLETGQISEAIHSAASRMESQTRTARKVAINSKGDIRIDEEVEQDESTRYLSYIVETDFQNLDDRFFHVDEIANLLGSSHHQHRLYSINLLTQLFRSATDRLTGAQASTQKQLELIFGTVMNPDVSQIPERLCHFIKSTGGSMLDSSRNLSMLINAQMSCLFDSIQNYRDATFITQATMKGLRPFQIYLCDTIQGGSLFDQSVLVPCSQQALPYLDMLFDNQEVLVLLAKSLEKVLNHSLEIITASQENSVQEEGQHQFEADCVGHILETLLWFTRYSPQTSQVAERLLLKSRRKLIALVGMPRYEGIWGQVLMILKELMLSSADIKPFFTDFIEPNTGFFTSQMLKELTGEGAASISQHFSGVLKVVGFKQVDLLSKQYISGLNVTFLEASQKSKDWKVLCNLSQFFSSLSGEFSALIKPSQLLLEANEHSEAPEIASPLFDPQSEDVDTRLQELLRLNLEPRALQATLACLNSVKHDALRQLKSIRDPVELEPCLAKIMRLLNSQDEPIYQDLVMDYLFKPDSAYVSIDGPDALILVNFFLGYCSSNEQVQSACQISMLKQPLRARDFFLPLLDDWYIRPLYFVDKLDEQALQNLTRAILAFATSYFCAGPKTSSKDLLRVTKDEFMMVITFLINTKLESFSAENLALMDRFVDKNFFTEDQNKLKIEEFTFSKNPYLIEAYKQTFLQDNFVQALSNFFNQRPVDQCPTMYKVLLITLHSQDLSLENRKTLLSEVSEVLPAIFRQETDLVPQLVKAPLSSEREQPQEVQAYHRTFVGKACFKEFHEGQRPLLLRILGLNQ